MREIMYSKLTNKISFILAFIFMGVKINLIGSISITEIFVLLYTPCLIAGFKNHKIPYLNTICVLFLLLVAIQVLSEYMVGNTFSNALKGLAGTLMALLLFLFFLEKLCKDYSLIKWIPVAGLISLVLFGDQFGFAEKGQDTYFKFYVAPIIGYIVCFLSLLDNAFIKRYIVLIFLVASLVIVVGGARSLGFSLLFSALLSFLYKRYKTFNLKRILPGAIVVIIAFQLFYALLYVPKVSSGEWGSDQNRMQLARIDNSTNVFMMLFSARADFYVAYLAFMDKPLWGHGSWAKDENLKYAKIQANLFSEDDVSAGVNMGIDHWVPMHSVVMGMGTRNGIFAFLVFLAVFILMYYIGIKALFPKSPYNVFLIYTLVESFQHLMFGPIAILKNNGSLVFAMFLTLYCLKKIYYKQGNGVQVVGSYGNL